MPHLISVTDIDLHQAPKVYHEPFYGIFLLSEATSYTVDGTRYTAPPTSVLFLSPYQQLAFEMETAPSGTLRRLQFHGDYYCIEQHKEEVACNGLLFNNAYLQPHVTLPPSDFAQVSALTEFLLNEKQESGRFDNAVKKSYLQLILALCSRVKHQATAERAEQGNDLLIAFQHLLATHHQRERSVAFYAEQLGLSPEALSRHIKNSVGKTATQLIQDQVILTAKRLLHLTRRSIKEIATEMNFTDEFYFSRYFKREVGLSPKHFREDVGISIVAK